METKKRKWVTPYLVSYKRTVDECVLSVCKASNVLAGAINRHTGCYIDCTAPCAALSAS